MWRRVSVKNAKKIKKRSLRQRMFNILLGSIVGISLIAYLIQANGLATKGYKIKELEAKISDLRSTQKELEGKSLEMQSLSTIIKKLESLEMVEAKNALYIHADSKTALK